MEEFEERYHAEPGRYRDSACEICLGPVIASVVLVKRPTWQTVFHATTFDELGRDSRILNASKLVMVVGFPPDRLSNWIKAVAMATRVGKSEGTFWDHEFHSVQ
jgi:hypothetical protein